MERRTSKTREVEAVDVEGDDDKSGNRRWGMKKMKRSSLCRCLNV